MESSFFNKDKLIADLKIARMSVYFKDFLKRAIISSLFVTIPLNLLVLFVLFSIFNEIKNYKLLSIIIITLPMTFMIMLKFFLRTPEIKIIRSRKNIDAEITSVIRFLMLDLRANAPLFDALKNITENFEETGKYIKDITTKVKLGTALEDALTESVENVPSENLRILFWQIINHLQTGVDINKTLHTLVDEIQEQQKIEFKKYGKRLNVLSLFYMIIAIILPTIGFTMISAALIFIGFAINSGVIILFWIVFSLMQIMFLALSSGNRPVTES